MDFIYDSLSIGKGIRILIIMDIYTRKIVGYRVDRSITGNEVVDILKSSIEENGKIEILRSDNGLNSYQNLIIDFSLRRE